jgi:16S rRNA (uracil1498-N3)-methyltransferase
MKKGEILPEVGLPNALRKLVRLYVHESTLPTHDVALSHEQSHYLTHVMRKKEGDKLLVFHGTWGEWLAHIVRITKKEVSIRLQEQTRSPSPTADIWYLFAPLKSARLDYMVQKATELGVARLIPVKTERTQVSRINRERLKANTIEAAEQCGLVNVPEVGEERSLIQALADLAPDRLLIFCDEHASHSSPLTALKEVKSGTPCAVLIGPEGGFTDGERTLISRHPHTLNLSLGSRIVRADTAAVMALTLVQACVGDL